MDLDDVRNWWKYVRRADWRHPYGEDTPIDSLQQHPVAHATFADAEEFARWEGKELPTEAEWEFALSTGTIKGTLGRRAPGDLILE